jgi:hypothetical protein
MQTKVKSAEPRFHIIDESFTPDQLQDYDLFMLAGRDEFSFCILNHVRNKFTGLVSFLFLSSEEDTDIVERITAVKHDLGQVLKPGYRKIILCYVNNVSTLVPSPLFDLHHAKQFLSCNHFVSDLAKVHADRLNMPDAWNVFAMQPDIEKELKDIFPGVEIHHHSTPLIESLVVHNKLIDEKVMIVNIHVSQVDVIITQGKNLVFFNSFSYRTSEDCLYYIMFVCEQLQVNAQNVRVVLTGNIRENSALYLLAKKYIRNLSFYDGEYAFEFSYGFDQVPLHCFHTLFNLHLCAS